MTAAIVRWTVPSVLLVVGVVVAVVGKAEVGEAIVGAAFCVVVAVALMRFGFTSDVDREREEAARAYFDEHGHWPDRPRDEPRENAGAAAPPDTDRPGR